MLLRTRLARTRALSVSGLLLLVTLVTYLPALDGKFISDDDAQVTAPSLRSLTALSGIGTDPQATQRYYPLTHSAFWLEYQPCHVANVVLHLAGALLLWRILTRLALPGALPRVWFVRESRVRCRRNLNETGKC